MMKGKYNGNAVVSPSSFSFYGRDVAVVKGNKVYAAADGRELQEVTNPEEANTIKSIIAARNAGRKIQM